MLGWKAQIYTFIGSGIIILFLIIALLWQRNTAVDLRGEVALLEQQIQTCIDNSNVLQASVDNQNAGVKKYQEDTEKLKANIDQLTLQLEKYKKLTNSRINTVINAPAPADKSDAFDKMFMFMKEETSKW